jgi:purine-binding chemotaxis protein CheW
VIDLRKRLGMKESAETHDNRIVVIRLGVTQVGMIVDGVSEVLTIQKVCVEITPSITTTVDSTFITGFTKIDDWLIILLDLGRLFSTEEQKDLVEAI